MLLKPSHSSDGVLLRVIVDTTGIIHGMSGVFTIRVGSTLERGEGAWNDPYDQRKLSISVLRFSDGKYFDQ